MPQDLAFVALFGPAALLLRAALSSTLRDDRAASGAWADAPAHDHPEELQPAAG